MQIQSVIALKGFIKQIKLLMVTKADLFWGRFHTQLQWLIDLFESILSRNTEYLVIKLP